MIVYNVKYPLEEKYRKIIEPIMILGDGLEKVEKKIVHRSQSILCPLKTENKRLHGYYIAIFLCIGET